MIRVICCIQNPCLEIISKFKIELFPALCCNISEISPIMIRQFFIMDFTFNEINNMPVLSENSRSV